MFCYKDQWDPGCTTTRHNIFNLALSGHCLSYLKCDRVATRLPWLMPIKKQCHCDVTTHDACTLLFVEGER